MKDPDPKLGAQIQRLVIVHFDPPTEVVGRGENIRACEPSKPIACGLMGDGQPNPFSCGTGSVGAVTCPECKETPVYRYAVELSESEECPNYLAGAFSRLQEARG